ncbi:hypothetical protein ET495_16900 [Xylanimonas allomyrinae]|uniref:Uncharacterized protein n=1 Tax=Xylanimonas allomyrinae TaxID=2509459 RepID=A0A4P6ENY7_9MICO|nr:hypothetical protein [Xylanimonas allomyrinae]QAY64600.1 hypothetical protein ET495_16900 [Xylanimonas allomyrinae]
MQRPLEVAPPTDAAANASTTGRMPPAASTTLDVYWTATTNAEVFLGTYPLNGTNERQTIDVALPVAGDPRLTFEAVDGGTTGRITVPGPVDPVTGRVSGGLRVQTHDASAGVTPASSQYSRVATITGQCAPVLTIMQAETQPEETLARDLRFTVTSSMALVPDSFEPGDVHVTAATATSTGADGVPAGVSTLDGTLPVATVVSVTPVPGTGDTRFEVVVRANDTARVSVSIDADAVVSQDSGLRNPAPAASGATAATDSTVTFVNPVTVTPPRLRVVAGDPIGKDYSLTLIAGAPSPTADLRFTATVDQPAGTPEVRLSTGAPVIPVAGTSSEPVTVRVAIGDVAANTPATVVHTVASDDPAYDGLLVPALRVALFMHDPNLRVVKEAWVERPDGTPLDDTSVEGIRATGVRVPAGSRLADQQTVCFVYTVTNETAGEWATDVTEVTVTDSDARLGDGGVIGQIPVVHVDEPKSLFACARLVPRDTTVGGNAPTGE